MNIYLPPCHNFFWFTRKVRHLSVAPHPSIFLTNISAGHLLSCCNIQSTHLQFLFFLTCFLFCTFQTLSVYDSTGRKKHSALRAMLLLLPLSSLLLGVQGHGNMVGLSFWFYCVGLITSSIAQVWPHTWFDTDGNFGLKPGHQCSANEANMVGLAKGRKEQD